MHSKAVRVDCKGERLRKEARMSGEMIVAHCSPTLAGIKTANMFTCPYASAREMRRSARMWGRALAQKGLRVVPLRYMGGRGLMYIYRPSMLSSDLKNEKACRILRDCGYGSKTPRACLGQLVKRLESRDEFPHEIGLFLGYPPEDVDGFIVNKAGGYKYSGYWKVYSDEEGAKRTFARYRQCTRIYSEQYAKGKSIERLTVAD